MFNFLLLFSVHIRRHFFSLCVKHINKDRIVIVMHLCPINKDFLVQTLFTQSPIFDTPNFILGPKVSLYSTVKGLQ